jgi:cytochrome c-type biogenesis protein CcmH
MMVSLAFAGLALLLIGSLLLPLIKRPKEALPQPIEAPHRDRRAILLTLVVLAGVLLVAGAGIYAAFGFPQLPGQARDSDVTAATSVGELEKQMQRAPTPAGYKQLANMYFTAGQYDKAVAADHRAIDLGANDSTTWSEFGESIVMARGGQVVPPALAAFTNAISRDPHDARARFYIGMAEAQIGNLKQAVAIWRDLEKGADPKAKWLPMVRQHIVAFSKEGGFDADSIPPAAPSAIVMRLAVASMRDAMRQGAGASAGSASESDQDAMIRAMVERLATRMKTSPNDADGWRRLAHAYNVLGEPEKAQDAIAHAVRLRPNDVEVRLTLAETKRVAASAKR